MYISVFIKVKAQHVVLCEIVSFIDVPVLCTCSYNYPEFQICYVKLLIFMIHESVNSKASF